MDTETRDLIARLDARIQSLESRVGGGSDLSDGPYRDVFVAEVDEDGAWEEKTVSSGGSVTSFADGRSGSELVKLTGGQRVAVEVTGNPSHYVEIPNGVLVPVTCTKTSGSAGSKTTQCTFVYTCTEADGTTHTGVTPTMQRPSVGKTTQAVIGIGYDDEGTFRLLWCDEVPTKVGCV